MASFEAFSVLYRRYAVALNPAIRARNELWSFTNDSVDFFHQALCDDLEQTQPQLGQLLTNGRLLLDKVPDEDRAFLESQLNALEELQANVIRKSLAKQEELIRYIVQQQDFQTQVQSCMHVLQEVETSLGEWELGVASGLSEMKEKLSLCEVGPGGWEGNNGDARRTFKM